MITKPTQQRGFTLIEIMVAIAVLGILLSIGVGSYSSLFKRNELRGASESLYSLITYAKSESIKSNALVAVTFKEGTNGNWCAGLKTVPAVATGASNKCDCTLATGATSCEIKTSATTSRLVTISGGEFKKVGLTVDTTMSESTIIFDSVRGMPSSTGRTLGPLLLKTDEQQVKVEVNVMGNVKSSCAPVGSTTFTACS